MQQLIQIVPSLPPAISGVGDYAYLLAKELRAAHDVETRFLVGDPEWEGGSEIEGFSVNRLNARTASDLCGYLSCGSKAKVALLQYVGYGFEKRGCPKWLVDGLEDWTIGELGRRLITMFHEVSAFGPVWSSSFWLSGVQRALAARLGKLSYQILTNKDAYAAKIRTLVNDEELDIRVLPVFSNVGEPEHTPTELRDRQRRLVVFGSAGHRELVFTKSVNALTLTCQSLNIREIWDIGVDAQHGVTSVGGVPVISTGLLSADKVSAVLSDSIAGFFNYPFDFLGKSGVFAAYCAHRLLPVGVSPLAPTADGLERGHHFWLADEGLKDFSAAQVVADNVYDWYQGHKLSSQAKIFAACIGAQNANGRSNSSQGSTG